MALNTVALSIKAERVVVLEPASNAILYAKNPTERRPVASIQKLLTALLIVKRGGLDADLEVLPSDLPDQRYLPMTVGLRPGHLYPRQSLLTAMLIASANDAALALARDHSGSVAAFVDAMNGLARKLGMNNSRFCNPNGLPHDAQFSTAEDVATLARVIDDIPTLRAIVRTQTYKLAHDDGSTVMLRNTNRLLHAMSACDGMKTGFTRASGHCLAATGSFGNLRRIVVVLNSVADRIWTDASQLLACSLGMTNPMAGAAHISD